MTDCSECCTRDCPIADDNFDRTSLSGDVSYTALSGAVSMPGAQLYLTGTDAIVRCESQDDAGGIAVRAAIDVTLNHSGDQGRLFIKGDDTLDNSYFLQVTAGVDAGVLELFARASGVDTLLDSVPVIICGLKKYRMEICYGEDRLVGRAAGFAVQENLTTDVDDRPYAAFGTGVASGVAKFDDFLYYKGLDDTRTTCPTCLAEGAVPPQKCNHTPGCRPGDASVQNTMYLPPAGQLVAEIEMHATTIEVNEHFDCNIDMGEVGLPYFCDAVTDCCDTLNDITWSSCLLRHEGSHKCLVRGDNADHLCRCPFFIWAPSPSYDDCARGWDFYEDDAGDFLAQCGPYAKFYHPVGLPMCGYDQDLNTPGDNVTSGHFGSFGVNYYAGWIGRLVHTSDVPRWQLIFYIGVTSTSDLGQYFVYEGADLTFDSDVGLYQPLGDWSMSLVDSGSYGEPYFGIHSVCDNVATATVNFSINQLPADDATTCSTTTTTSTTPGPEPCDYDFCSFDCVTNIWEVTTACEGGTCQCYTSDGTNISEIEGESCDGCVGESCLIICLGNPDDGYHWVISPSSAQDCSGDSEFCNCWFDGIEMILGTECDFDTEYLDTIGGTCGDAGAWGYCYSTAAP